MSSGSTADPGLTLVVGLGNPILGDDGVGWRVVEEVQRRVEAGVCDRAAPLPAPVPRDGAAWRFDFCSLGGIALMEQLIGSARAILVDAVQTGGVAGTVHRLTLDDLPTLHADSVHDASLKAALDLGRRLGAALPDEITIIAVEAANLYEFGEALTPAVAAAVPRAADMVLASLAGL
jgi:hydrogenase maturation protease